MKKMRFKKRRLFALLLAFVLCVGSVDVSAFAAGTDESVEAVTDLSGETSLADENDQTAGDNESAEVIQTESEETKVTEESEVSEEPEATEETKASEEPEATEETKASEEPEATEESKASEETKTTEEPEVSDKPEVSEESKASEETKTTEESEVSDEPEVSEESKVTEESKATEESKVTEEPEVTEEPKVSKELEDPEESKATEAPKSEEAPAEVKAFVDAVAAIPEITHENTAEVAEYVYGPVSEAYEVLLGTEYEEHPEVLAALSTYAAAIDAVDAALDMEPDYYAGTPDVIHTLRIAKGHQFTFEFVPSLGYYVSVSRNAYNWSLGSVTSANDNVATASGRFYDQVGSGNYYYKVGTSYMSAGGYLKHNVVINAVNVGTTYVDVIHHDSNCNGSSSTLLEGIHERIIVTVYDPETTYVNTISVGDNDDCLAYVYDSKNQPVATEYITFEDGGTPRCILGSDIITVMPPAGLSSYEGIYDDETMCGIVGFNAEGKKAGSAYVKSTYGIYSMVYKDYLTIHGYPNRAEFVAIDAFVDVWKIVVPDTETYTVKYTDGVDSETVFADQEHKNLKVGDNTPAFNGTPTRKGYTFKGWKLNDTDIVLTNDEVKAKKILAADAVDGVITYTATWIENLTVTKTAKASDADDAETITSIKVGDEFVYKITVENPNSTELKGVTITDELPDTLTYVSSSDNGSHTDGTAIADSTEKKGGTVKWTVDVPANRSKVVTVTVKANAAGSITNTAIATWSNNGSDSDDETVEAANPTKPELELTKTVNKTSVKKGNTLEYTITVKNNGTADATNVKVSDTLPKELGTNISNSNPNSYSSTVNDDGATFTWNLGTIAAGESKAITFTATAVETGKIENSASVTSDESTTPVESDPVKTVIYNLIVTKTNGGFQNGAPSASCTDADCKSEDDGSGKAHVHYTVTVKNDSGFDLYGLDILDDLTTTVKADNEEANEGYVLSIENVKLDGNAANGMVTPVANGNATHSIVTKFDRSEVFANQKEVVLTYDFVIENTGDDVLSIGLKNKATGGTWTTDGQTAGSRKARARSAARNGGYDIEESAESGASMGSEAGGTVKPASKTYTVTYKRNDGTDETHATVTKNSTENPVEFTVGKEADGITDIADPTRTGYIFQGWAETEDATAGMTALSKVTLTKENRRKTLYAVWTPKSDTTYKVEHYQQNLDGTGYTLKETEDLNGTTGTPVTAVAKTYEGFTENINHTDRVPGGTIAADGTLVLKLYYDRDKNINYTVKYLEKDTSKQLHVPKTVSGKTFGETVTETAETIGGYTPDEAGKSLTLNKSTGNEIVFYYTVTPRIRGFGKMALYEGHVRTEAAKTAIGNLDTLGVTIPTRINDDDFAVVTLSDFTNDEIKLLYDLDVAGDPGASYSVSDEDTEWVGGNAMEGKLPDEADESGKAHAHIYVTKTFKKADVNNGWLHNAATVKDYYNPGTGKIEPIHEEEDWVAVEHTVTVTVNYVTDDETPVGLGSISYTLNDKASYNHGIGSGVTVPATGGANVESPAKITDESGQTYVYDEVATTDNLTGTIDGDDVTINVIYSLDEKGNIGTDDEGNPTDEPDGIPDKYQVKVTFKVENGAWNDETTADVVKYLTKYKDVDGEKVMAVDGEVILGNIIPEAGEKPDAGFVTGDWGDNEPAETTVITGDTTYTYTYKPAPGSVTITVEFVDENGDVVGTETVVVDEGDAYDVSEEAEKIPDGYEPNGEPTGAPVTGTADTDKTVTVPVRQIIRYTVTYTDGVDGEEVFADQVTSDLVNGAATPAFVGTPVRVGYTFAGWTPEVAATVTDNVTYTAQWEAIPYTVTYTDGVDGEEVFADQTTDNLTYGAATPAFVGTPVREGYTFAGWTPEVAATITGNVIYTAQWTPNEPTPEEPTPEEPTPEEPTPEEPTPEEPTPEEPTPEEPTPVDPTPEEPTPNDPAPTPDDPTPTPDDPTPTPDDDDPTPEEPTQEPVPVVVVPPAAAVPVAAPTPQVVPVAPTQPVTPAVPQEEEEPVTVIDDPTLPLAEPEETVEPAEEEPAVVELEDEELPLAAGNGRAWALVNFALMNLAVFETLMLLIGYFVNTKKEEDDQEEKLKKKGLMRLISLPVGIISIIAFCLTEDISLPTGFVDRWTLLMAVIAIVQTVLVALSRKKEEKEDGKMA